MSRKLSYIAHLLGPRINEGKGSEAELFARLKALQYPAGIILAQFAMGFAIQNPSPITETVLLSSVAVSTAVFTSALIGLVRCSRTFRNETQSALQDTYENPLLRVPPVDMPTGEGYYLALQDKKTSVLQLGAEGHQRVEGERQNQYSDATMARLQAMRETLAHFYDPTARKQPKSDEARTFDMKRFRDVLTRYTEQRGLSLTKEEARLVLETLTRSPMIELAPGVLEEMVRTCVSTLGEYISTLSTFEIVQQAQEEDLSHAIQAERIGHGRFDIPPRSMNERIVVEDDDALAIAKTVVNIASRAIPSVRNVVCNEIYHLFDRFYSLDSPRNRAQKHRLERLNKLERYLHLALDIDAQETTLLVKDYISIDRDRIMVNIEGCSCYSDIYRRVKAACVRFPHLNHVVVAGLKETLLISGIYDDFLIDDYGSVVHPLYPSWVEDIVKSNKMGSEYQVVTENQSLNLLPQLQFAT